MNKKHKPPLPTSAQCEEAHNIKENYLSWKTGVRAKVKPYLVMFSENCVSEKKLGTWQDRDDPYLNKIPALRDIPWLYKNICYNPADIDATSYFKGSSEQTSRLKSLEEEKKECGQLGSDFTRHTQFHMNRKIFFQRLFQDEMICEYTNAWQKHTFNNYQNCKRSLKSSPKNSYSDTEIEIWMTQYRAHVGMTEWLIKIRSTRFYDCPLSWVSLEKVKLLDRCPPEIFNADGKKDEKENDTLENAPASVAF